jgi:hypothetical protein
MSESSGPAGQGKTPSKPKATPKPSPKATFNLDEYIRGGIEVTPAFGGANPTGMFGVGSSVTEIMNHKTGEQSSLYDSGRFTFSLTGTGIDASDSTQPENPLPVIALLADYGNRANYLLSPNQNLYSAATAASFWLGKNTDRTKRNWAFETLLAKGYIPADLANGLDRNSSQADMILASALTNAVTSISVKNYNLLNANMNMLTLDEGLFQLDPNTSTTSGGGGAGFGGTSTRITRQEFKPEDYRIAVDQAYRDITGQAASDTTLNTYIKVLQKLEEKNPAKQVAKTTGTAQNNTTVVKETGGVSQAAAEDLLLKQAIAEPETEYYQKATTFMDYFNEAIKAKVDL